MGSCFSQNHYQLLACFNFYVPSFDNLFRKAWETSSSGLSSFLGRLVLDNLYLIRFHILTQNCFNVFFGGLLSHWTRRRSMVFLPGRSSLEDLSVSLIGNLSFIFGRSPIDCLAFQAIQVWKILVFRRLGTLHSYLGDLIMVAVIPSQSNPVQVIREILAGSWLLYFVARKNDTSVFQNF